MAAPLIHPRIIIMYIIYHAYEVYRQYAEGDILVKLPRTAVILYLYPGSRRNQRCCTVEYIAYTMDNHVICIFTGGYMYNHL